MDDLEYMAIFILWSLLFSFVISSKVNIFVCYKNHILKVSLKWYKNESLGWKRSQSIISRAYDPFIEKPRIKRPKYIGLLHKLPFYDESNIKKI